MTARQLLFAQDARAEILKGVNATEEFGDMVEMGVIDSTKMTRLALQNAVSVAGLLLTTETAVVSATEHSSGGTLRMPEGMNAMM